MDDIHIGTEQVCNCVNPTQHNTTILERRNVALLLIKTCGIGLIKIGLISNIDYESFHDKRIAWNASEKEKERIIELNCLKIKSKIITSNEQQYKGI